MDLANLFPVVWAQSPPPGAAPSGAGAASILILSLRRWCGSLTLSPPETSTTALSPALAIWLLGLAGVLILAILFQGPRRAIGQLLDVPGHGRLLASSLERLRRSGRLLAVVVGGSVVCWTTNQTLSYSVATGRDDELLMTRGQRLTDVALNQGYLAALTPLRDLVGLGLMIPLLIGAGVVLFQFSTDRWGQGTRPPVSLRRRSSRWSSIGWGCVVAYAVYRFVGLISGTADLPLGGCVFLEVLLVPLLTAMACGVMVAWVLVELRNAGLEDAEGDSLDPLGVSVVIPAAVLTCVLAFPAFYVGPGLWMLVKYEYLPASVLGNPRVAGFLRWQLGWGLIVLQALGLLFAGMFGSLAWSRGTPGDALLGYFRLLKAEGGRLAAALAVGGAVAGALSTLGYLMILSLPASTWGLSAADSYAHYGTILVGLILASSLVELGERSIPLARLANPETAEAVV